MLKQKIFIFILSDVYLLNDGLIVFQDRATVGKLFRFALMIFGKVLTARKRSLELWRGSRI